MNRIKYRLSLLSSFILFFALTMMPLLSVAQSLDPGRLKQFEEAILKGEDFLKAGDYAKAKAEYQKALTIDPSAKYPKDKLAQIRKVYIDPEDEARFASAMESGNRLMQAGSYALASEQFTSAVNIKPEDKTARDKLAEAGKKAAELKAQKEIFAGHIKIGDQKMAAGDLAGAREAYISASETDSGENYPMQKIREIDSRLAASKAQNESYEKALADADEAYMSRDFATARIKYEQALKIKPGENYPKSMLERVAEGMAQMKDARASYDAAIAGADRLFASGDFEAAVPAYTQAMKILPGEQYPASQIEKANNILEQRRKQEDNYNLAVAEGDRLMTENKPENARTAYENALKLKPGSEYPQKQLTAIALQLQAARDAEREKLYQQAIASADNRFEAGFPEEALTHYNTAIELKPGEPYPSGQIAKISDLLNERKAAQAAYEKAIQAGDAFAAQDKPEEAKLEYSRALTLKPGEEYPAARIREIEKNLAAIQELNRQYEQLIAQADSQVSSGSLDAALEAFRKAAALFPARTYPTEQIALIEGKQAENRSKEEHYASLIDDADRKFGNSEYDDALAQYQQALQLKPDEKYPAGQIEAIKNQLKEQEAQRLRYNEVIKDADQKYDAGNYGQALGLYQNALAILDGEKHPRERITTINRILEERKSLEENYERHIREADDFFREKSYANALTSYENAINLKPDEKYPRGQRELTQKAIESERALLNEYQQIIADADDNFSSGNYPVAERKYREAQSLKKDDPYPSAQLSRIAQINAELKALDENYSQAIREGDRDMAAKDYVLAKTSYQRALSLKPGEAHPTARLNEIARILGEQEELEQQYNSAIGLGDAKFDSGNLEEAEMAYQNALKIKPGEKYPVEKIALTGTKRSENEQFLRLVSEAGRHYSENDLPGALALYRQALQIRPGESHASAQVQVITGKLEELRMEQDREYLEAVGSADRLYAEGDYTSAMRYYELASELKPEEKHPKDKLLAARTILMERARNKLDAYNKIILNADRLYQDKIYDQAIDAYNAASLAKEDETYPSEMIKKIRKYLEDHAMIDLVPSAILINTDEEKRFSFTPIEMRLRKNNYIAIKARKTSETEPKIYINYGKGSARNGGIVLRSITSDDTGDYLVRVSIQDKWYREDNNWISVYSEGGSVEITRMQIAQGD